MKVIDAIWFTEMGSITPIGIVVGRDEVSGVERACIGTGIGHDTGSDANRILNHGAKFPLDIALEMMKRKIHIVVDPNEK